MTTPIKRTIGYDEGELNKAVRNINSNLNGILDLLAMMVQQVEGRRQNIDKTMIQNYGEEYIRNIRLNLKHLNLPFDMSTLEDKIKELDDKMNTDLY